MNGGVDESAWREGLESRVRQLEELVGFAEHGSAQARRHLEEVDRVVRALESRVRGLEKRLDALADRVNEQGSPEREDEGAA